ncbi:TetR/AcrR family transcriptional regulator [Caulobacter sp. KR2-114]|uniref:TetR/AcrR family transcriptional regulator n=1 Tax=Caulobacter sp. KR2-114 TaxID=3400912 RepID=UPI003BFDEBE7
MSLAEAAAPVTEALTDGRALRSARTREKIATAMLALIRAGNPAPTSEEVAIHAGVGHRTVFRRFQDMESLYVEMNERVKALVRPVLAEPVPDGPPAVRIAALAARRARVFEEVGPFYRAGEPRLSASPILRRFRDEFAADQRRQLLAVLPELGADPARAAAADLIASMDAWLRLRLTQGLTVDAAREAVIAGLGALVG